MTIYKNIINSNKRFVATIGDFDGCHIGHKHLLTQMKNFAEKNNLESIIITFDPNTKYFFSKQKNYLLTLLDEKINLLSKYTDNFLIIDFNEKFKNLSTNEFMQKYLETNIDHLFVGKNFRFGAGKTGDVELLASNKNFKTYITELQYMCSATDIRHFIKNGQIRKANELLGYSYFVNGVVIKGDARAVTLGFPTINLLPSIVKIEPKLGVYKVNVKLADGRKFLGVANLGKRPTFNQNAEILLEVHMLNFNENLYGQNVHIEFTEYIREEKKFSCANDLIEQIKIDIKHAINNGTDFCD